MVVPKLITAVLLLRLTLVQQVPEPLAIGSEALGEGGLVEPEVCALVDMDTVLVARIVLAP
jgi:hypothetical protein